MSRFIVGLLNGLDVEPCSQSLRWAATLPESTTARQAWALAEPLWRAWLAESIGLSSRANYERVRDRLIELVALKPELNETGGFLARMSGRDPEAPTHPADEWTLRALGVA